MFNWFYAFIGVVIGMAVEPVGRAINHGPMASPLWASSPNARNIVSLLSIGFVIFSANFGIEFFFFAILEIIVGVFTSYFLFR